MIGVPVAVGGVASRSLARVVEAGLEERMRLERALHDGPLQRLLALAGDIGYTCAGASPAVRDALELIGQELAVVVREVREIARDLYPALLTSDGLAAAVQAMIERLPLAAYVDIAPDRFAPVVEATVYDLIRRIVTDAVAEGDTVKVAVTARAEHGRLRFSISVDGPGDRLLPATIRTALSDRVVAFGGEILGGVGLSVHGWIPAGHPTAGVDAVG